jgi:TRAP-type C4-dicarboxylate transport system substrate-binding protein
MFGASMELFARDPGDLNRRQTTMQNFGSSPFATIGIRAFRLLAGSYAEQTIVPAIPAIAGVKIGKSVFRMTAPCALFLSALLPNAAVAEPIELKLAFFSSDQSMTYLAAIKPFIDAVNSEGHDQIKLVLYSGGVLGRDISQQPGDVLDGNADIAFVVPGYTPARFPDNAVIELPGLFNDTREGTLVYTRLIALHALAGYEDFVVIGAYVSEPETIHSRLPIASIADLKGQRIRVNNIREAATLEKLGAIPVIMQINKVTGAIGGGEIDGATAPRTPVSDYGIKRVATNHYFLGTSGAPLALLMNRKKFEALPKSAQDIIHKYSGEWPAARFIEIYDRSDGRILQELKSDPARTVVFPSPADLQIAHAVFTSVIAEWAAKSPHDSQLLKLTEAQIAELRATR